MMIAADRYTPADADEWNAFVGGVKNHVFFFHRDYMDYHADRFPDHSVIFRQDGAPVALLPATAAGPLLSSHAGLSFGGLLTDHRMTQPLMMEVVDALVCHLRRMGMSRLSYKAIPYIYHAAPAQEDLYALSSRGATLARREVNSVIDLDGRMPCTDERRRRVEQVRESGIDVRESEDFHAFWRALETNLQKKYGLRPVHSLEEIERLRSRFPDRIRLFGAYKGPRFLAGVVIFESDRVAHAQYTANSAKGRVLNALDLLFSDLLTRYSGVKGFFSFGVSSFDEGRRLNAGLIAQKEGFGARSVVHDWYELVVAP